MFSYIYTALWYFLPAGIANVAPIFAARLPLLRRINYPIDFYQTFQGLRILGDHKTIRGFMIGTGMAIITAYLQFYISHKFSGINDYFLIDFLVIHPLLHGLLLGTGALVGDSIESFFKRRSSIESGSTWFPYDQLDYIVGGLIFSSLYTTLSIKIYVSIILLYFVIHLFASFIGYLFGFKSQPI